MGYVAGLRNWPLPRLDAHGDWPTFLLETAMITAGLVWLFLRQPILRRNVRAWVALAVFLPLHCWAWIRVLNAHSHIGGIYFSFYVPAELGAFGWVVFSFCFYTHPRRRRAGRRRGAHRSSPPNPKDPG